jgi:hypothetical protein
MPVQTMQAIAEHSLFKAALPLVTVALVGSISWIFVTVMELNKVQHRIEDSEIPQINADIAKGYEKIEDLENKMTDLRIKFAELTSPGQPYNRIDPYNRVE